jgi:exodeoxyribonuclease V alpha subunit
MLMYRNEGVKGISDERIKKLEMKLSIQYAPKQKLAIMKAAEHNIIILTGGPGTGKTTTLNGMIGIFEDLGGKVALAAPTGRAAKRLSEVTGREAKTIHRLLEPDFFDSFENLKFSETKETLCMKTW